MVFVIFGYHQAGATFIRNRVVNKLQATQISCEFLAILSDLDLSLQ